MLKSEINKIHLSKAEFSEKFLYLNGHPLDLSDYPHLRAIYNSGARTRVLKFSRQTAKSTTLANLSITSAAMIPDFKILYVAPTVDQTKVFSHDRVAPVLDSSPLIRDHYINSTLIQNVFMKQFLNRSRIYLRYALRNADRLRGYSADMNMFDETQDLNADIIPIVQETMTRSEHKFKVYAGTPKRKKGTLADLWYKSSQSEYVYKCGGCGHWNILGENNIGKYGAICSKCGYGINPQSETGQWVSNYSLTQTPQMEGYRVCALHFANAPWVNWEEDILLKLENQPTSLFHNETLALEYDDGVSPVTEMQIQACCNPDRALTTEPDKIDKSYQSVMGIDYGPRNSEKSITTITVVQKRPEGFVVVYAKKFLGNEADYAFIHGEVPRLMKVWNCVHLAADYGMGEAPNSEIRSRIGYNKVIAYQHEHNQKEAVKWNAKMQAYTLNRTRTMLAIFNLIQKGKIQFPRWEYFEPFAQDILNIYSEYDEVTNSHKYGKAGPDDFFQSTLYGVLSLSLLKRDNSLFE